MANAGHLSVESRTVSKDAKREMLLKTSLVAVEQSEAESFLYDKFNVEVTSVQVFYWAGIMN